MLLRLFLVRFIIFSSVNNKHIYHLEVTVYAVDCDDASMAKARTNIATAETEQRIRPGCNNIVVM